MSLLITIVAFILIFGLLIFVHELGHFVMARRSGIKVEEFAFGMPLLPRIFKVKRGETEYSIYPVPFGGFVRMLGEDGGSKSPRSFAAKPVRTRAKVLVAGVVMNLLLAFVLLTIGFLFKMQPITLCASDIPKSSAQNAVTFVSVTDRGPAHDAGLKAGDVVTSIDGKAVQCQRDVAKDLSSRAGQPVSLQITRDGQPRTLNVTPRPKSDAAAGTIGVAPADHYTKLDFPWYDAPYVALIETLSITAVTFGALGHLFVTLFTHASVPVGVTGPVGIAKITGEVVHLGLLNIIRFVAVLSLSLAVFNILPIPALDGGRLFFVIVEGLRGGKPITPKLEGMIHAGGFVLLILFIIVITYFDVTR